MKKTALILLAVIGLIACKKEPEAVSVPFEKLEHYFSITDVTSPTSRKITDQETFDGLFNYGAVMGDQQAPLDFTKEFVIDRAQRLHLQRENRRKNGIDQKALPPHPSRQAIRRTSAGSQSSRLKQ